METEKNGCLHFDGNAMRGIEIRESTRNERKVFEKSTPYLMLNLAS
jgi:hypothetical protein